MQLLASKNEFTKRNNTEITNESEMIYCNESSDKPTNRLRGL